MKAKKYDYIKLCLGYPKADEWRKIIWRRWIGFKTGVSDLELFGTKSVAVYIIDVSQLVFPDQHLPPLPFSLSGVLTLNLKKKYWDQIRSGSKLEEYREIKPYWTKRLYETKKSKSVCMDFGGPL